MSEKTEKLLDALDKKTLGVGAGSDRALYCLLLAFKDVLPEPDDYFHKAFRQTDVTDNGLIDSAIWHLIGGSKAFWEAFEEVRRPAQ